MSRKLTIRRVGNHLPTIILVGFLFFSITLGWLSVVGLPDSLLRKIEAAAAEQGIYLKVDELHLEPTKGLAAQANNIRLYVNAGEQQPLLKADSVTASLHIAGLLGGDVKLKTLRQPDELEVWIHSYLSALEAVPNGGDPSFGDTVWYDETQDLTILQYRANNDGVGFVNTVYITYQSGRVNHP